jgi:DNA-binding Lrp family transcriptional regulator
MPLDDKEQRILAEIEKQFYEEDPELARAVKKIEMPARFGVRLSVLGVIIGLTLVIAYVQTLWIAVAGFFLVVASATSLINALRLRGWRDQPVEVDDEMTE